jgi:GTPase SAR1 family protein
MTEIKKYNIIVIGWIGVGKTTFINNLIKKHCFRQYNLYDISNFDLFCYKYYPKIKIDGVIIMFSLQNKTSYNNIKTYHKKIVEKYGDIPIILCGSHADIPNRKITNEIITYNLKYIELLDNHLDVMKMLGDEIKYKEFINKFQEIINGYLEIKDDKINELNCKINLIKKITF